MTSDLDLCLGDAYRIAMLENDTARAVAVLKQRLDRTPGIKSEAEARLPLLQRLNAARSNGDMISKVHADLISAALDAA